MMDVGLQWRLISRTLMWLYRREWILERSQIPMALMGLVIGGLLMWMAVR